MHFSVVLPVYNEEEIVQLLFEDYKRNEKILSQLPVVEFIFVDDGSTDGTYEKLQSLDIPGKKVIRTEHMGLSHALYTGINAAAGDIIITLDSDGQFSFEDIQRLVEVLKSNDADIVAGHRVKRNDNIVRRISSKFSNFIRGLILNDEIKDSACTFRCFKKEVRDKILYRFDGFHRFISSFAIINDLKLVQIPITHRNRSGGNSKYGIINRLPDVVIDVIGVRWLKHKRFSQNADIRKFSFYPDLFFLILFLYVFFNLFSSYFRVVDDFWLYGSLNRFIGYDYSKSYGWNNFIFDEIIPLFIRLIYALLLKAGKLVNVQYPLEWTNKIIGISVFTASYVLFAKYFKFYLKEHLAKWLSFSIVFFGLMSSEIYSGLARSFTYILIPLFIIYLKKDSLLNLSILLFFTALIYPVVIPLFALSIFIYYIFTNPAKSYKVLIPAAASLAGLLPMLLKIDITAFSSPAEGDLFLKKNHVFNLPVSSDLYLLFGFTSGRGIVEWLNFNLLHQWILNEHLITLIVSCSILSIVFAIGRRLFPSTLRFFDFAIFIIFVIFLFIALLIREYVEVSYIFKWGCVFLSLYWLLSICKKDFIFSHSPIFSLGISAILAFIITHILSNYLGFGVHEPARQMQRPFAIIIPVLASALIYNLITSTSNLLKNIIILILTSIAFLFFPNLKLVSPPDAYVIKRITQLPAGSIILSHPLTANWIVSHTNKYSTIIDEQIRVTKKNPIRGSTEKVLPTEMAYRVLSVYYSQGLEDTKKWCEDKEEAYILVEEYYYSDAFFQTKREPYFSFVERNNKDRDFVLLKIPLSLRHYITPESYLISCREISGER